MIDYTFSLLTFEYYILVLVRIASFVAVAPFFGLNTIPARVKAGFAMTLVILVVQISPVELAYDGMLAYGVIVVREAITGLMIGMMANISTYIIGFAGRMIDMEVGLSMAQEYNPMTRTQESITGNLYYYSIMLLLLVTDMYHYILRAIFDTFTLVPVNTQIFNWEYLSNNLMTFISDMILIGFRIMLPVFVCTMVLNCVLGIMAKVAPQMNMFSVGIQIKIFFGYAILVVTVILLPKAASMISEEIKMLLRLVIRGMYSNG